MQTTKPTNEPQNPPESPRYLTEAEAATVLRVAPKTLSNWRILGSGPHYLKPGGRVLYTLDDLRSYAEATRRRSTSERHEAA